MCCKDAGFGTLSNCVVFAVPHHVAVVDIFEANLRVGEHVYDADIFTRRSATCTGN